MGAAAIEVVPAWLDVAGTVVDTLGSLITAFAVVAGGLWAYFKFVKGRTYRPRLEVRLDGGWIEVAGRHQFHARVFAKNIGGTSVQLIQHGSALAMSTVADPELGKRRRIWHVVTKQAIFKEHQWVEPLEQVGDELLLDLDVGAPIVVQMELRLVWSWKRRRPNVVVFARKILPANVQGPDGDEGEKDESRPGGA